MIAPSNRSSIPMERTLKHGKGKGEKGERESCDEVHKHSSLPSADDKKMLFTTALG